MPGPTKTVREIYESKVKIYNRKTKRWEERWRYPHLRVHITKRGPFYYIKKVKGGEKGVKGHPITDSSGKPKRYKISGSQRVWHRGHGYFSEYSSIQDRRIKKPPRKFPKGYLHTGDKKPRKKK